jgi:O-antigen/teichoic acid export membrane protein
MSKSLKDLAYLITSNGALKVLGVVSIMIYTRFLLKEELALVPLFVVMGRLSMVIFSFGILPTLVREIPHLIEEKKIAEAQSAIGTSLLIVLPGILVFSGLCFIFSQQLSLFFLNTKEYTFHFKLMSLGFFFSGVNQTFSYIYWSLSRYQQESKRILIVGVLQAMMGIAFVLGWGIIGLIAALVISSTINTILYIYNLKDIIFSVSFKLYPVKKLIIESLPFHFESYLQYFRAEGDQLVVASLLGPEALAIYYIAKRPYDILHSFTQSLEKILTTNLAKVKGDLDLFSRKVSTIVNLNFFIILPVMFLAIGVCPTIIVIIAGKGYDAAVIPAMVLLLLLMCQFFWRTTFGKSIFILKSAGSRFKVTLAETIILSFLMFVLGYYLDIIGLVTGRFIATIAAGFIAYSVIKKDVSIKASYRTISAISIHSVVTCVMLLLAQLVFVSYTFLALSLVFTVIIFFVLIHLTISEHFYATLNTIAPVKITDPFSYLIKWRKALKA